MTLNTRRMLSWCIDLLVYAIPLSMAVAFANHLSQFMLAIVLAYTVGYAFLGDSVGGAGVGKRLMGLRVVHSDDSSAAGFFGALFRKLLQYIPFVSLIDVVVIVFTPGGQRISDRILGLSVITCGKGTSALPIRPLLTCVFLPLISCAVVGAVMRPGELPLAEAPSIPVP